MSGFEELIYPHHFKAQLLIDVKGLLLIVELLYFSLCTQQGRSQKNPWQVGLGGCCVLVLHLFNFLSNFKDFLSLLKHCCTLICNQCLMFIFLSFQSTTKLLYKQSSAGCSDIDDVSLAVLCTYIIQQVTRKGSCKTVCQKSDEVSRCSVLRKGVVKVFVFKEGYFNLS